MRSIRAAGGIPEDDAVDAEHSSCGATPLQTGRVPGRARRTASQLREGSYGRDLGTRPADASVSVPDWNPGYRASVFKAPLKSSLRAFPLRWETGGYPSCQRDNAQ